MAPASQACQASTCRSSASRPSSLEDPCARRCARPRSQRTSRTPLARSLWCAPPRCAAAPSRVRGAGRGVLARARARAWATRSVVARRLPPAQSARGAPGVWLAWVAADPARARVRRRTRSGCGARPGGSSPTPRPPRRGRAAETDGRACSPPRPRARRPARRRPSASPTFCGAGAAGARGQRALAEGEAWEETARAHARGGAAAVSAAGARRRAARRGGRHRGGRRALFGLRAPPAAPDGRAPRATPLDRARRCIRRSTGVSSEARARARARSAARRGGCTLVARAAPSGEFGREGDYGRRGGARVRRRRRTRARAHRPARSAGRSDAGANDR